MSTPSQVVTFLFTDLVGSTRLWEERADAMALALERHDQILRQIVGRHGGDVVKTTGDGVIGVFPSAIAAVDAAVAGQLRLGTESWPAGVRLTARMSVHTGEARERDQDYFGPTLNRAARLMATAHGGQILLSRASEEVVRERLPDGYSLSHLGVHQLRDLSQPEDVYQLVGPGLEAAFPPLRSLGWYQGNLPMQVSSFVGREAELADVGALVDTRRLVTLTGAGGAGKTRLAIQAAAMALDKFPDGAWLCELAGASDGDGMVQLAAAELGVSPHGTKSLQQRIGEFLRPRHLLIILDNCEHLLDDAADLIDRILRTSADVTIIATSREAIGLPGEAVFIVPPLSLSTSDPEARRPAEAVELFSQRARDADSTFVLDESNLAIVTDVCRQLDGLPLALELAAANLSVLSISDIQARLSERLRFLGKRQRRGSSARHQTLRATLAWSYEQLTDRDRAVFDRLSVFAGSFDAAAAQAVTTSKNITPSDVVDALGALISKSMVTKEAEVAGRTRYRLLETMRAFGVEHLDDADEVSLWRRRHAEHFAEVAVEIGRQLQGRDELAWRPRFHVDLDNMRGAVSWAIDADTAADACLAWRIVAALAQEAVQDAAAVGLWAERCVAHGELMAGGVGMGVLGAAAWAAQSRGDFSAARSYCDRGLQQGRPSEGANAQVLYFVVALAHPPMSLEQARAFADAEAALQDLNGDGFAVAFMMNARAFVAALAGERESAVRHADLALRGARSIGNPSLLAGALYNEALTARTSQAALAALDESIELTRRGASSVVLGFVLAHRAQLRARLGEVRAALTDFREAAQVAVDKGDRLMLATVVDRGIDVFASLGHAEPAAVLTGAVVYGPLAELTTRPRPERGPRDDIVARVRRQLGPPAFNSATAVGAALADPELLAYIHGAVERLASDGSSIEQRERDEARDGTVDEVKPRAF